MPTPSRSRFLVSKTYHTENDIRYQFTDTYSYFFEYVKHWGTKKTIFEHSEDLLGCHPSTFGRCGAIFQNAETDERFCLVPYFASKSIIPVVEHFHNKWNRRVSSSAIVSNWSTLSSEDKQIINTYGTGSIYQMSLHVSAFPMSRLEWNRFVNSDSTILLKENSSLFGYIHFGTEIERYTPWNSHLKEFKRASRIHSQQRNFELAKSYHLLNEENNLVLQDNLIVVGAICYIGYDEVQPLNRQIWDDTSDVSYKQDYLNL